MSLVRRIAFEYLDVEIDVLPAIMALNPVYEAACKAWVMPLEWAVRAKRHSEQGSNLALMKAYAEGVVVGSPTPALEDFKPEDWIRWFKEHPEEWQRLRGICEAPENFQESPPHGTPRGSGSPPDSSG